MSIRVAIMLRNSTEIIEAMGACSFRCALLFWRGRRIWKQGPGVGNFKQPHSIFSSWAAQTKSENMTRLPSSRPSQPSNTHDSFCQSARNSACELIAMHKTIFVEKLMKIRAKPAIRSANSTLDMRFRYAFRNLQTYHAHQKAFFFLLRSLYTATTWKGLNLASMQN